MKKKCRLCIDASIFLLLFFIGYMLVGCSSMDKRHPVPAESADKSGIPGVPDARFWNDEWPEFSIHSVMDATDSELRKSHEGIYGKPHNYLAISGGGSEGAFGAGLLNGWTESGKRPEFAIVTGISTGALIAPFAFLGPAYDGVLETVYTTTSTKDILKKGNPLNAPLTGAMADPTPLRGLIERYVSSDVIDAIALEHSRGRRLFIGTMNLDAGRSMIWNIGAIAASEYPERKRLIHDVLLASASIPIAFPPVVIPVEVNGKAYDEMHVDGGVGSQVFVYPAAVKWRQLKKKLRIPGRSKVYVIRNAVLEMEHAGVEPKLIPVASRTVTSMIRTQGIGDLYQIWALTKRDGLDFKLAYVPSDFDEDAQEPFDPVYMNKLFELGKKLGREGYQWSREPPGFENMTN